MRQAPRAVVIDPVIAAAQMFSHDNTNSSLRLRDIELTSHDGYLRPANYYCCGLQNAECRMQC